MQDSTEKEELAFLTALGMTDDSEKKLMENLSANSTDHSCLLTEVHDFLAESMAFSQGLEHPRSILKERILVSTEPRLAKVVTDENCGIVSISRAFTDLCGYRFEEIRGKKPGSFLQGAGTDPKAIRQFRDAIHARAACTVELLNYHKSGSPYWVKIEMTPIIGPSGELEGYTALEEKLSDTAQA